MIKKKQSLHDAINATFKKEPTFQEKLIAKENKELADKYKNELDEAAYWLCKAYLVFSIGNEYFEEAQDILKAVNLQFSKPMREGITGMSVCFDKMYGEMKQIIGQRGLDNFAHDYFAVESKLKDYLDSIISQTINERTQCQQTEKVV